MNLYTKTPTELVVSSREVLEARPRSQPPEPRDNEQTANDEQDALDNAPCTD